MNALTSAQAQQIEAAEGRREDAWFRALEKAHAERAKRAAQHRAEIIREELARRPECQCGITPRMTLAALVGLGAGCTAGQWVCPALDAIRRRLGH